MNNLALAKILHHFYNSRLSVKQLDQLDNIITDAVRELFSLYKSTTRIVYSSPEKMVVLALSEFLMSIDQHV